MQSFTQRLKQRGHIWEHEQTSDRTPRTDPRHDGRGQQHSGHREHDRGQQEHNHQAARGCWRSVLGYQDQAFRNLSCKRIQLDEIWAFCYAKQRNVMTAKAAPEDAGDLWTWVALCADSKLVPSWRIGDRSGATAIEFVCDLSGRLANPGEGARDGDRAC